MANPEHLAILKQGVETWNEWRRENRNIKPQLRQAVLDGLFLGEARFDEADMSYCSLVNADLEQSSFDEADLQNATLINAKFSQASLIMTNMKGANLCGANFSETYLIETILDKADLKGADFSFANIVQASLKETNFAEAVLDWTVFADVDLSSTKGLERADHFGPSIIGIESVHRSKGRIPLAFLRGCGAPRKFISYTRSLVGKPIDFYSCFISHSSKDKRFCDRLYTDLRGKDVRIWYFPEDAKWGKPVWGEIDRSIKKYDKLIVVCSKNSLTSGPVLREIERALKREDKEGKNVLFPITIDRYIFDEWQHPRKDDVLAKVVGTDFVGWNRDTAKYDKAFKKLLKALKAQ